ncbi:pyridoxal phosphate-dependent aminotransferase [Amorphoplanes nipponensis]|uniref:Pyridoxal phosphate-dependent aminotransferase n=1 Tax=Actinoplanes nipponensis TaxID=135950 RepID=A0A919MJD2_9ACTN|nr:pyridoxal phosphate-dependent aminotransferase [Actinoplanes nipponensis]GIE51694.1 pyridoxal phosphate-dependent aminotransferase [Actinoplanes nipponensis]
MLLDDTTERSRRLPVSCLHEIHRLVTGHPREAIALHVGEPHIRMPAAAAEGYVAAIRDGRTAYADAPGLPVLRAALAERLADNGAPSPDRVFVTPGSCQAISAIFQSIARPGGEVILPRVHWPMHLQQILLAGLEPRFAGLPAAGRPVTELLDEAAGERTVALLINSPANPSGHVWSAADLEQMYAWAARRGVWIISDEAYEDFVYEGEPCRIAQLDLAVPPAERIVFSVHTFSKGFSMTGCRLGYATAPRPDRAELLSRVQEATLVAPATPVQYAGLAALGAPEHLSMHHAYVRATRDEAVKLLTPLGVVGTEPRGGWYLLLDLSAYTSDTYAFCRRLLAETDVGIAPGRGFLPAGDPVAETLVRVTLCAERETTVAGVRRLARFLQSS